MIIVTGTIVGKPEARERMLAECIAHSERSRAEPGCLSHNVHLDGENFDRLVFVERWTDTAALKIHFTVPESGAFVRAMGALAVVPPSIEIYEATQIPPASL